MKITGIEFKGSGNSTSPQNKSTQKSKIIYNSIKYTGYGALGLGIVSGIAAANKKISSHKYLAYAAGILSLAHIGIIEWLHCKKH